MEEGDSVLAFLQVACDLYIQQRIEVKRRFICHMSSAVISLRSPQLAYERVIHTSVVIVCGRIVTRTVSSATNACL